MAGWYSLFHYLKRQPPKRCHILTPASRVRAFSACHNSFCGEPWKHDVTRVVQWAVAPEILFIEKILSRRTEPDRLARSACAFGTKPSQAISAL
jgi:hypothetical protein